MLERQYLIAQAVDRYNQQFGKSFAYHAFDIQSLPTRANFDKSYEIFTINFNDYVRLHIHVVFGHKDRLEDYGLETDETNVPRGLGDEVFVSTGTINRFYLDNGYYKYENLNADPSTLDILFMDSDSALLDETGNYILLEKAS